MKVIVVGAGVIGAGVARSLALTGQEVLVLDRRGVGAGTTSTTFAWTNANRKRDPNYYRLNLAGMDEHGVLARELPGEPAYFPSGGLQWADAATESGLVRNVERLQDVGYPARWVDRDDAIRIAGDIRIPESATAIAHFPTEGYVRPDRLVENLLADAVRHGAVVEIAEVASFADGPAQASVTLAGGGTHTADRVVLAAGRWSDRLAAGSGFDIPMITDTGPGSPIIGLLGYVRSPRIDLRCVVHTPGLNLRPGAGRPTVLQALDLNPEVDPASPPDPGGELARTLTDRLVRLFPAADPAPEIDLRVGLRSLPADGNTIAGYVSPDSRAYCVVSHGGITLAPLLGRLVASEITTDAAEDLLTAFRPTRFAGVERSEIPVPVRPTTWGEQ
jgi:glycine/D-amino acid oxidase-like deaminating enzyme